MSKGKKGKRGEERKEGDREEGRVGGLQKKMFAELDSFRDDYVCNMKPGHSCLLHGADGAAVCKVRLALKGIHAVLELWRLGLTQQGKSRLTKKHRCPLQSTG